MRTLFTTCLLFTLCALPHKGYAQELNACKGSDLKCVLDYSARDIDAIEDQNWKDQIIRDLVMRYADSGYKEEALALIDKVQNPDTKAMSIRAAGFGLAKFSKVGSAKSDKAYFKQLDDRAETIEHEGARAIAYTYIAMGEALAGLDEDATQTALAMDNSALRNKALAESAEIQAERGDLQAARLSISHIDNAAFKDKAYSITAEIFIKQGQYDEAIAMAARIENAYKRNKVALDLAEAQINAREAENNIK
jgi:hypothetical protein